MATCKQTPMCERRKQNAACARMNRAADDRIDRREVLFAPISAVEWAVDHMNGMCAVLM